MNVVMDKNEMNKNKMILQYCPNFYKIINFDFEDDSLTDKLISVYRKFIFTIDIKDMKEVKTANQIDKILAKYIEDHKFRKELKEGLMHFKISSSSSNILKSIVEGIISVFNQYEEGTTRKIYISRWI